jgi:molecular chaperone GrpE
VTEHDITEQDDSSDGREGPEVLSDDPAALRQELDQLRAQADEYLDGWQRARAELTNAKRRMERELSEAHTYGNARLILQLLPVLDDFERAMDNLPPEFDDTGWVEGIALIQRKLQQILESEGVKEIEAEGQPFDPTVHEAIGQVEDSGYAEGAVADVAQKGYMLGERVLRPALVRVAK